MNSRKIKLGIGGHHASTMVTDEWLTPPEIISALGDFELDPCASVNQPWRTAKMHYTKIENGLAKEWHGCVYMNPPYSKQTNTWLSKLKQHNDGIALVFARTETKMFFEHVWYAAHSVLFIEGRLFFHYPDGRKAKSNSGGPSCLIAYGKENTLRLKESGIKGKLLLLHNK